MKQKLNTLLYGCLLLLCGITTQWLNAQTGTQLKGWHIAPNLIDLRTTPNVKPPFTTNAGTPGSNSIYDSEGKLLFYIANYNKIYNKFNQLIGTMALGYVGLSEISIVPNPANDACTNKYYIIYPQDVSGSLVGTLRYDVVDMNGNSGLGLFVTGATLSANVSNPTANPIAVSKLVGGNRYLYYIHSTFFQLAMHTITATGITSSPTFLTPSFGAGTSAYELELSNAGDKIAFHKGGSPSNQITILDLNPTTGLATGTSYDFTAASSIYGLEFNNAGNKLFYSTGTGIYVKYLTTPFNQVTITSSFNKSMLEKNFNGSKILCASTSQLNWIDASTDVLNLTPISCGLPYNPTYNFVLMPDQIDGENYDATNTKNVDVDIYTVPTSATWFTTVNPFWLIQQNTYLGTLTSFPKVRVARQINIPNAISINIDKMTFEFFTNAELNVNGGGNLTLSGALLQGHPCGLMWRGVSMNNNASSNASNFTMTTSLINSRIYDAIKGVEVNGSNVTVNINTNSSFDKNEKGVVLNSVNPSIVSITGSRFYSTIPLIDQTKGQVLTTSGTVRYGITGIEANTSGTSTNKLKIGSTTTGNVFKSGQYGIRSLRTDILIQKNNFQDADVAAVSGDAAFLGSKETDVLDNTFLNNNSDTWLSFGCNQLVRRNTFTNTKSYSIFWTYNYGNTLIVGNDLNAADANTFQGYMWAGIAISSCDDIDTKIDIHKNTFQNAPWAGGVYISESTLTSAAKTYDHYLINNNTFNNVEGAVKIINIKGSSATDNGWNGDNNTFSDKFDMQGNTINFSTSYNVSAKGIRVENSIKNRALNNAVTSDNSGSWQNEGISFLNSQYSLIKRNVVQAGFGIGLGLDMMESNVLCNTLQYCVNGIQPSWSWIRNTGIPHGNLSPNIGRQNTFISNTSSDITMYNCNTANYQWMSPNTTFINYVLCTGTNIIFSTGDPNPCPTNTTTGKMASDTDSSSITSNVNDIPTNYSNDVTTAQNKSKQYIDGLQSIKINNAAMLTTNNMTTLAKAQLLYEAKDYNGCSAHLQQISNTDVIENNIASVLGILNTLRQENRYEYKSSEKADLIAIAQSDSRLGGQGVHYARGILLANYNLQFEDPYLFAPTDKSTARMIKKSGTELNTQLIGLYPNPAKTQMTLSTNNGSKTITIYNNMGSKIYSTNTTGLLTIDVMNWNSGVYLVEIYDAITNKKEITKFIIE
jgi:hypothetical protein